MIKAIYFQFGATWLACLMAGLLVGTRGALSAGLAGLACLLPNLWFALRLKAAAKAQRSSPVARFFVGECIKVAASAGLLVIAVKAYPNMHWPSFLVGMLMALQASFLAFWKKP
ncbi:MAG: ATP synthase subunit I [Zoogloeaceae bacterium]|jgi:ATP synthase protein I|nr:ATP synthase subunit I [Zoogloeaceae bacterium]